MFEKLAIAIVLTLSVHVFTGTASPNSWLSLTLAGARPKPSILQRSLRHRSSHSVAVSIPQRPKTTVARTVDNPAHPTQSQTD